MKKHGKLNLNQNDCLMTVKEYATVNHYSDSYIRRLIKQGRLIGKKTYHNAWLIKLPN